jgi:hypothetical protein
METFYVTIAISLISGLTYLAYKHGNGYAKIFPWALGIILIAFYTGSSYNIGVSRGYVVLIKFIESTNFTQTDKLISDTRVSEQYIYIFALVGCYLVFLRYFLPYLIGNEINKNS